MVCTRLRQARVANFTRVDRVAESHLTQPWHTTTGRPARLCAVSLAVLHAPTDQRPNLASSMAVGNHRLAAAVADVPHSEVEARPRRMCKLRPALRACPVLRACRGRSPTTVVAGPVGKANRKGASLTTRIAGDAERYGRG